MVMVVTGGGGAPGRMRGSFRGWAGLGCDEMMEMEMTTQWKAQQYQNVFRGDGSVG